MVHPDHILRPDGEESLPEFEPVYPLTQGLTQRTMGRAVEEALARAAPLDEWIEPSLKRQRRWPDWRAALGTAHAPLGAGDLAPDAPARERLAYDEVLAHQLTLAIARARMKRTAGAATPRRRTAARAGDRGAAATRRPARSGARSRRSPPTWPPGCG